MRRITVRGAKFRVSSGIVKLDKQQAKDREHALKPIKGKQGIYEVLSPVEFKRGEEFGYDGDVPKSVVEEIETDERRTRPPDPPDPPGKDDDPGDPDSEITDGESGKEIDEEKSEKDTGDDDPGEDDGEGSDGDEDPDDEDEDEVDDDIVAFGGQDIEKLNLDVDEEDSE